MGKRISGKDALLLELRGSFDFLTQEANTDPDSPGYGLVRDKSELDPDIASIASTGFALSALPIGVERDWMSRKTAEERAVGTLTTFAERMERTHGFFYHFVNLNTACRAWNCEVSIIDTALFLCGAMTAGVYFGGETQKLAQQLFRTVEWTWYTDPDRRQFRMGYKPETGFWGHWDHFAEQLMLYVLAAGSPTFPTGSELYRSLPRMRGDYGGERDILHSWGGSLFTYQFSHAWIDFRDLTDADGVDWFENSVKAVRAARQYAKDQQKRFRTYGETAWGMTASVGPDGYSGSYGSLPAKTDLDAGNDGTVAPYGTVASVVFAPKESLAALEHYWNDLPKLHCRYGLRDAFNLDVSEEGWYARECIGIDKGITALMIENALTGLIWRLFMQNESVQRGLDILGFRKK